MALSARFHFGNVLLSLELTQPIAALTIPKGRPGLGKIDMHASRPMAGFAAHVDLAERGAIFGRVRIEVALQVGAMAVGAHRVPALRDAGPVQIVLWRKPLLDVGRIEVE